MGTDRDGSGPAGVLKLYLEVDQRRPDSRTARLRKMVLGGANDAIIAYYREKQPAIRDLAINKRYVFEFRAWDVGIHEGPDLGLRVDRLSPREMLLLKAYTKGDFVDYNLVMHDFEDDPGRWNDVSDDDAIGTARTLVAKTQSITLADVKRK
jgi:hypothetical protein